jgi:hypothetical protein
MDVGLTESEQLVSPKEVEDSRGVTFALCHNGITEK